MSLYVLIERGPVVISSTFNGQMLEFFQPQFPLPGSPQPAPHMALFLSPLDAALCQKYMNGRPRPGEKNRYELAPHDAPDVMKSMDFGLKQGFRVCLVLGFSTDNSGRLVAKGGCYSLCPWTLTSEDVRCLQGRGQDAAHYVLDRAYRVLSKHGALDHQEDIQRLDVVEPDTINKMAELALSQAGFTERGQDGGFSVFSPRLAKWRKLV